MNRKQWTMAALSAVLLSLLSIALLGVGLVAAQEPVPTLVPPTLVPTVESGMSDVLPSESGVARIQRDGKVRVGILYNQPPFGELNLRGEVSGFDADLARALGEAWGIEVEFVQVTRQTALDMLLTDQVDLLLSAQAHRRELDERVEFSQTYYPGTEMMVVRNGDGATVLGHMEGRKVGVVMGTLGEQAVSEWLARTGLPVTVHPYVNLDQALSGLLAQEVDGVVENRLLLQRAFPEAGTVRFVDEPVSPEPYAIVMRRQDVNLRNLVNRTLQFLVDIGRMNEIHQAHFADAAYPGENFTLWNGLGEDAPTPSQFGIDIPLPVQYVAARLQQDRVLRVAGMPDLPEDAPESARRLDTANRAVIEAMAARWGVTVNYIPNSADNALELVASGQADIAVGVEPSWEWADRVDFTQHYLLHGQRVMVRANSQAESFTDLRSEWMGYFIDAPGSVDRINEIADEARVILGGVFGIANEEEAVYGMIDTSNYDAVFGDSLQLIPHIQASPDDVRLTTGGTYSGWYSKHFVAFAVPRNDVDFRLLVDYTLQELARDGSLTTLLQPVLLPEDTPKIDVWPGTSNYLGFNLGQPLAG